MSGNLWADVLIWFFAISGFMLILCDIVRYFMYKDTMPEKLTILLDANALGINSRVSIANLLNLLYEQNPNGNYEVIVLNNDQDAMLCRELHTLADASEFVYIANAENVGEYIKQSFQ